MENPEVIRPRKARAAPAALALRERDTEMWRCRWGESKEYSQLFVKQSQTIIGFLIKTNS